MTVITKLENVLSISHSLLTEVDNSDGEKALERIEVYLASLEEWQDDYKKFLAEGNNPLSDAEKEVLKSKLGILESNHSQIMQNASLLLDLVKEEIGKVNKSSAAIKKYISNPIVNTRPTIRKG